VTGAAGGIGEKTAELMLGQGASVFLVDLDADRLSATADKLKNLGTLGHFSCDLTDSEAIDAMVSTCIDTIGGIDILINNAGVECVSPLEDIPLDKMSRALDINLKAVLMTTRAIIPVMKQQGGGSIVSVSSQAAKRGTPEISVYTAAKAGVLGMTRSLAIELAPIIRLNAVCPGIVKTDMMARHYRKMSEIEGIPYEEAERQFDEFIPLRRQQTAEDVANGIVFLASDSASEITGQALNICGGMVMD